MDIIHALRWRRSSSAQIYAFVGAGGKTTAIFQLAREMFRASSAPVFVTATTHLGIWQTSNADQHISVTDTKTLETLELKGVMLFTGKAGTERTDPVNEEVLNWLRAAAKENHIPLLIEADGSRQLSLKAPAAHEPPIPNFSDIVVCVAGLSALGKPIHEATHRPEIFSALTGLELNQPISPESIVHMLTHPQGGLKNIPPHAQKVALLNQSETDDTQAIGGNMAGELLRHFDSVLVGSLMSNKLQTFEKTAGIILAAGSSTRFGSPKQLLDWKGQPFVRHVAETALKAGLSPVVVATGAYSEKVQEAVKGLPVEIVHNEDHKQGQGTTVARAVASLPPETGSAVFLLADQPQIPVEIVRALVESHINKMQDIIIPLVLEERRANPVLFDRVTFPNLMKLTGDVGGRAVFSMHKVEFLPWHDDKLLFDVDTPEDYQRLINDETL